LRGKIFAGAVITSCSFCSREVQRTLDEVAGDVDRAIVHGASHDAELYQEFISAHRALPIQKRVQWWTERARVEEIEQLDALGRALPRGGRVAPLMLDACIPTEPRRLERMFRGMVDYLGWSGVSGALEMRAAVRVAASVNSHNIAAFSLARLDRRMQQMFELWLSPGLLRLHEIDDREAMLHEIVGDSARTVVPHWTQPIAGHRCYSLSYPQVTDNNTSTPLAVAHVSLQENLPCSIAEVLAPKSGSSRTACFWAFGVGGTVPKEALDNLGLEASLRRAATAQLRAEFGDDLVVGALTPLTGFVSWLRANRSWEGEVKREVAPPFVEALRRAVYGRSVGHEVSFVDQDGDTIHFSSKTGLSLDVKIGNQPTQRVSRLRIAGEGGSALLFLVEPGPHAFQVMAPPEVVQRGDLVRVAQMAETVGILPVELANPALRLGNRYLRSKSAGGQVVIDPIAHFHFSGGAALNALHWRADESPHGLARSLGMMASYTYDHKMETARASEYIQKGHTTFIQDDAQV